MKKTLLIPLDYDDRIYQQKTLLYEPLKNQTLKEVVYDKPNNLKLDFRVTILKMYRMYSHKFE